MGRFRSFLRRAARPAAMVAVTGSVALSLVVSTPTNAQAFVDAKAKETFVMGAQKVIAPAAQVGMAAASVTPVGMVLRVGQLAMLAYSTQDIWMPIVAGAWGQATGGDRNATGTVGVDGYNGVIPELRITGATYTGRTAKVQLHHSGSATEVWFTLAAVIQCKRSDGTTYQLSSATLGIAGNAETPTYNTYSKNPVMNLDCTNSTDLAEGSLTGTLGGDPKLPKGCRGTSGCSGTYNYPGPANVTSNGTMSNGTPAFDPYGSDVKYKIRSECISASGTKSTVEAESSGEYLLFPSCEAAGKGHGTGKTSVVGFAPGTTTEQPLWDTPAAPSDPATPLCDASRPTGGCVLSVELDGKPCVVGDPECENWAEIQKNDPNNTRLKCRFGPYTIPMAQCKMLEQAYRIGGAPATEENTDGNPDTSNWNDPRNKPVAPPAPSNTPLNAPAPGSSGQPTPGPSGSPESKMANCWPSGWAVFNPLEWVLKPVRCAFEPSQTQAQIQARAEGVMTLAQGKAPISFMTNLDMAGPSSGGCPNWTINVNGLSQNVVCDSSFTHALLAIRAPLFGLIATAMVWPLLRSIWYAAIPVLRVTPSSGGK